MATRRFDVCIIGGGLVGCFAGHFLRARGRSVVILEKGEAGHEASGVNYGNVRLPGRNPVEFPLCLIAHEIWESFEAVTGEADVFDNCGHAYLGFGAKDQARLEQYAREAGAAGIEVDLLDGATVRRRWPVLAQSVIGATFSTRCGTAEPSRAAPAAARLAVISGVELLERTCATAVTWAGSVLQVATDRGLTIECGRVVNAAGAWAGAFAAELQEPVPMFAAGPPIIETESVAHLGIASMQAVDGAIIFRQARNGRMVTSSFPRQPADLETGASPIAPERIARDLESLAKIVPALAGMRSARAWSGVEGYLPDMLPVIGPSGTMPGVVHAFGFSGHGFQMAPGVGRVVADLIVDGRSDIVLDAFAIGRWSGRIAPDERLFAEFDAALIERVTRA